MTVFHVKSEAEFDSVLGSSALPVVVKFGAQWCGPCKKLEPGLDRLSEAMERQATFISVDIDDLPDLASRYEILGIPSVFVFRDRVLVKRMSTSVTPRSVKKMLEETL